MQENSIKIKEKLKANPKLTAWIILIFLALMWGTSFILIKKAIYVYEPLQVASLRVFFASVTLFGFAIVRLKKVPKSKFKILFLAGFIGSLIPAFLFPLAQTQVGSAVTGVLNATTPIFTLIFGILIFRQRLIKQEVLGLSLGLIGALTLALINKDSKLTFNFYVLYVIIATICYGLNVNIIKASFSKLKAIDISSISLLLILPFGVAGIFYTDVPKTVLSETGSLQALLYIFILGSFSTAIALILFNYLVQISTAIFASSVTYLIPIVALVWGMIDGERLVLAQFAGMLLIVGGIYMINRAK